MLVLFLIHHWILGDVSTPNVKNMKEPFKNSNWSIPNGIGFGFRHGPGPGHTGHTGHTDPPGRSHHPGPSSGVGSPVRFVGTSIHAIEH